MQTSTTSVSSTRGRSASVTILPTNAIAAKAPAMILPYVSAKEEFTYFVQCKKFTHPFGAVLHTVNMGSERMEKIKKDYDKIPQGVTSFSIATIANYIAQQTKIMQTQIVSFREMGRSIVTGPTSVLRDELTLSAHLKGIKGIFHKFVTTQTPLMSSPFAHIDTINTPRLLVSYLHYECAQKNSKPNEEKKVR